MDRDRNRNRHRHRLVGIVLLAGGLLLGAGLPDAVPQEAEGTDFVVVSLEGVAVRPVRPPAPSAAPAAPKLMLGAVAGSGTRVQKSAWPEAIWVEATPGADLLPEESGGVPLLALPEAELDEEIGFVLIVLDNRVPAERSPETWLSASLPAVLEAAAGPLALWVARGALSPEEEAARVREAIEPHLGENAVLGVLAAKFSRERDWGVREAPYRASVGDGTLALDLAYRVRRVSLPPTLTPTPRAPVRVRLMGIARQAPEARQEPEGPEGASPVFLWSRGAGGFLGERLNGLLRRLPFVGAYELREGEAQVLAEPLYVGTLGPFLSLDVGIWAQGADGVRSLGRLNRLWTGAELRDGVPDAFAVRLADPQGKEEITLSFTIEVGAQD